MDFKFLTPQDQANMLKQQAAYFERDYFGHEMNKMATEALDPITIPKSADEETKAALQREIDSRQAQIDAANAAQATIDAAYQVVVEKIEALEPAGDDSTS